MVIVQYINDFLNLLPYRKRQKQKSDFRATLEQRRRILNRQQVELASAEVVEQLRENVLFQQATHILMYYPIKNEVDLRLLFDNQEGKHIYLPVSHRRTLEMREYKGQDNLKKGRYHIPEPQTPAYKGKLDLIIVPGVGFDKQNYRLGRGGGYYDRFLKHFKKVPKIGVGYNFQLVSTLPIDKHDIQMTQLVLSKSV